MNNKIKKSIILIAFTLTLTFAKTIDIAYAKDGITNDSLLKLDNSFEYNENDEIYLDSFQRFDENTILRDNYHEYDIYYVYDQGIIQKWNWLSNPYFIISVPKGATYQYSKTISANISASINGNFPSGAKQSIFSSFGITSSGTKTVYENITISGPTNNHKSRDFYYQKGTHKHKVKVIREHRSNWDGILWTKTYYVNVNVPAIKVYSEET